MLFIAEALEQLREGKILAEQERMEWKNTGSFAK